MTQGVFHRKKARFMGQAKRRCEICNLKVSDVDPKTGLCGDCTDMVRQHDLEKQLADQWDREQIEKAMP